MATILQQAKSLPSAWFMPETAELEAKIARKKQELCRRTKPAKQGFDVRGVCIFERNNIRAKRRKEKQEALRAPEYSGAEQELCRDYRTRKQERARFVPSDFDGMGAKRLCRDFAGTRSRKKVRTPQTRVGRGCVVMGIYVGNYTTVTCKHAM